MTCYLAYMFVADRGQSLLPAYAEELEFGRWRRHEAK